MELPGRMARVTTRVRGRPFSPERVRERQPGQILNWEFRSTKWRRITSDRRRDCPPSSSHVTRCVSQEDATRDIPVRISIIFRGVRRRSR